MEKFFKHILLLLTFAAFSCEDYLDVPPEADITREEVFGAYLSFQGFVDVMYEYIIDYNSQKNTVGQNLSGETISTTGNNTSAIAATGNYWNLLDARSNFNDFGRRDLRYGIWNEGWKGIRQANLSLENLSLLVNATDKERNLIEGQAYFFRAFFHWEIVRAFGSIPYIEKALAADDDLKLPRFYEYNGKFDYQAVTEHMVEDLDKAAALLPEVWDNTLVNQGRIAKGTALALKAKALLYGGSPLMNQFSRNSATFDVGYMHRAADAAAEVLKLADKGVYALTSFDEYLNMFATKDGTVPLTKETILQKPKRNSGPSEAKNFLGRLYLPDPSTFGGLNAVTETPTQNFIDEFEMADGTKYKAGGPESGGYDFDNSKRWNGRDPRFRKSIYVDGDMAGFHKNSKLELYNGGKTLNGGLTINPYIVHKYWPLGVNKMDKEWNDFRYVTPHLRLAEIYLIYAEAVFEATQNANATSSNYSMSALQAINKVRARAGMPATTANPPAYGGSFRAQLRNERDVEFCFEGHRWYDLRRWKVEPDDTLYKMVFDKNYTNFSREVIQPFIFEERNFWMPMPRNLTYSYSGFPQNPGW